MPVAGKEKGIRSDYEVRFGITHPSYLGVNTQKAAFALLDAEGVAAENVRIKGGLPVNRGGQSKVNADTIAPIHGFTDTTSDAGINPNPDLNTDIGSPYGPLYVIGNDAIGVSGSFVHVDTAAQVVVTTGIHDSGRPSAVPINYNDGDYGAISFNETDTEVVAIPSLDSLFQLPRAGTIATCNSILALGTDLLAAWQDSGVGHKVSLWDGSNLTLDHTLASFDGFTMLFPFQGTAYLAVNPTGLDIINNLYRRNGNGTWSSIAFPSATQFRALHGVTFRGRLYIIGEDTTQFVIYSTDGNTLVKEHVITVAASAASPALAQFAIVRGDLYYWYHAGTGGSFNLIGRFDGASWDDEHKDLSDDVGVHTRGMGFVANHDGANAVFADDSGHIHVWQSDGINIFGTWTEVLNYDAGVYGSGSGTPPRRVSTVAA